MCWRKRNEKAWRRQAAREWTRQRGDGGRQHLFSRARVWHNKRKIWKSNGGAGKRQKKRARRCEKHLKRKRTKQNKHNKNISIMAHILIARWRAWRSNNGIAGGMVWWVDGDDGCVCWIKWLVNTEKWWWRSFGGKQTFCLFAWYDIVGWCSLILLPSGVSLYMGQAWDLQWRQAGEAGVEKALQYSRRPATPIYSHSKPCQCQTCQADRGFLSLPLQDVGDWLCVNNAEKQAFYLLRLCHLCLTEGASLLPTYSLMCGNEKHVIC